MEFTIHNPDATRPNNIPRGSTVKVIPRLGKISKRVTLGLAPDKTSSTIVHTIKNMVDAVTSVTVSRRFGDLPAKRIKIDPNNGTSIAQITLISGVMVFLLPKLVLSIQQLKQ